MKNILMLSFLSFVFTYFSYSQDQMEDQKFILPSPQISWDSLKAKIEYARLWKIIDINSIYFTQLSIDSIGDITNFRVIKSIHFSDDSYVFMDSTFSDSSLMDYHIVRNIKNSILSTKWSPAIDHGKPVPYKMNLPIFFDCYNSRIPRPIVIDELIPNLHFEE